MQAAKDAVKKFTSKDGHHDTTVHESVAPAVTSETVRPQQEERVTQAVDQEVHQDHYHTSVQPVHHKETLPEQHHHQAAAVETRHINHDDHSRNKERLAQEAAQFKDTSVRHDTQHTATANPTVTGQHVHHHVHENIQPVVHKQTVEPHVMHTTVPVHEIHQNAAQHHSASTLPAVGMEEFKKSGGSLVGREERHDAFDGAPRHVQDGSSSSATRGTGTLDNVEGSHSTHSHGTHGTSGTRDVSGGSYGSGATGATGATGAAGAGTAGLGPTHSSSTADQSTGKPSLMDKLNPKKDADNDGKPGFMK